VCALCVYCLWTTAPSCCVLCVLCAVFCVLADDGTKLLCTVEGLKGQAGRPCVIYSMGSAGEGREGWWAQEVVMV